MTTVALPGGDNVTLRPTLGFRESASIRNEVILLRQADEDVSAGDILAVLTEGYLLHGIESWTGARFTDADGEPIPVTKRNIRDLILVDLEVASIIGDEADNLYAEAVMLPLLRMASSSSPTTPTESSTSAPTDSPSSPPKRSKPSSISTIPTGDTATTSSSPDGVSSSSQSSTSAA